jgi:multidrug efflux pump subunit AcrA (membrane-fusion protein)
MRKTPFLLATSFLLTLSILTACGNDGEKQVLPRQVKVAIVGQDFINPSASKEALKNPEALSFDASGKVIEVLVKAGTPVTAGQALGRLMPGSMSMSESSALTSYRAARAEIQSAEADFKRYTDLRNKNFISASEFEKRIAAVEGARAKFEQSMEQLGFVTLRALESGVMTRVNFQVGQQVNAQEVVAGMKVSAKANPTVKPATQDANHKNKFSIPSEAIHGDGTSVYRVKLDPGSQEIGSLELVKVTIASVDESYALVSEGLSKGDLVVAAGWHALNAGQKVRVALVAKAQ